MTEPAWSITSKSIPGWRKHWNKMNFVLGATEWIHRMTSAHAMCVTRGLRVPGSLFSFNVECCRHTTLETKQLTKQHSKLWLSSHGAYIVVIHPCFYYLWGQRAHQGSLAAISIIGVEYRRMKLVGRWDARVLVCVVLKRRNRSHI